MLNILNRNSAPAVAVAPEMTEKDYVALKGRKAEIAARLSAMSTAATLIAPGAAPSDRLPAAMRQAAEPYMRWSRRKLDREMEHARTELANAADDLADAGVERERLAVRAMKTKAKELEPEHRAAVNRAADALEALNAALMDERRLRESCQRFDRNFLPDLSLSALGFAADHNSALSRWANEARRVGYLE